MYIQIFLSREVSRADNLETPPSYWLVVIGRERLSAAPSVWIERRFGSREAAIAYELYSQQGAGMTSRERRIWTG
jgi:hypothetical protein